MGAPGGAGGLISSFKVEPLTPLGQLPRVSLGQNKC